jgi:DNA adenine methylase
LVTIENCDGVELIDRFDTPDALHYCDPPYLGHDQHYRHQFGSSGHQRLAERLRGVVGMAIVSGYPSPLLEDLYRGWERREKKHAAFGNAQRTEVLWLNPACVAALERVA